MVNDDGRASTRVSADLTRPWAVPEAVARNESGAAEASVIALTLRFPDVTESKKTAANSRVFDVGWLPE